MFYVASVQSAWGQTENAKEKLRRIRVQYREGDIDRREYQQESALTKAALDATRVSVDDEVVRYGDHIEGLLEAWGAATLEERHQLLSIMLDDVYVDMVQGLVLGLKPEFLPLFNLGEPVTTGDSELVTGGMEQSRTPLSELFPALSVISFTL